MISDKFLWGNVFFGGKLQIDAKNSNFKIFESALYLKSVSMPLIPSFMLPPPQKLKIPKYLNYQYFDFYLAIRNETFTTICY